MAKELVQYYGTGRRKTSTARVFLRPGSGKISVNERALEHFFPRETHRLDMMRPFDVTNTRDQFDVVVTIKGGGPTGQCGAFRLGVARALLGSNPAFREALKKAGLLTRDAREVERKKYGRAGARRSFQFSKR